MGTKSKTPRGLERRPGHPIVDLIKKEVAVQIRQQQEAENALWAKCFADGATAAPKKQRDRVMRLASAKAALHLISKSK